MKIGLLAYSSQTGLGIQTYEFYRHMRPHKTLIVDLSKFNQMPVNHDIYEPWGFKRIAEGIPQEDDINWLVANVDLIFVAETPLNYELFRLANERGVKTVQQLNVEFFDYFKKPHLPKPSVFAMPSTWGIDRIRGLNLHRPVIELPVPINRDHIPQRDIKRLKGFVHIIGRPAVHDRNGTLSFLDAVEKIGNKYNYYVYYQEPKDPRAIEYFSPVKERLNEVKSKVDKLSVFTDVSDSNSLYDFGQVLVLPRRYGGLCLPMQEALSAGMPVIMTSVSPNYDRLPADWLVQAMRKDTFHGHTDVDVYEANVDNLVEVMLSFSSDEKMRKAHERAIRIAEELSWDRMERYYTAQFSKAL